MAILAKYKFKRVSIGPDGRVGALLQKLPDFSLFNKGVEVFESTEGCRVILKKARNVDPQTRKSAYVIRQMEDALRAIAAYKEEGQSKNYSVGG